VYAYLLTNAGFSDFHSFQAQLQQRLSHGLLALAAYTFGKSLDNASSESSLNLNAAQLNPKNDRGPSDTTSARLSPWHFLTRCRRNNVGGRCAR